MTAFTDAFAAAVANLQAKLVGSGLPAADVDAHIAAAINPLTAQISAIATSEQDDASKIAEIKTALDGFTTAFNPPAPTQTPAPAA